VRTGVIKCPPIPEIPPPPHIRSVSALPHAATPRATLVPLLALLRRRAAAAESGRCRPPGFSASTAVEAAMLMSRLGGRGRFSLARPGPTRAARMELLCAQRASPAACTPDAAPTHPHEARLLAALLHRHGGAVGHVLQALVGGVVEGAPAAGGSVGAVSDAGRGPCSCSDAAGWAFGGWRSSRPDSKGGGRGLPDVVLPGVVGHLARVGRLRAARHGPRGRGRGGGRGGGQLGWPQPR
jgi:hypothetical protein